MIQFKNISLNLDGQPILTGFNLSIKKKQKVVIFGKSGTGKSTLLRLLMGFVTPSEGGVLIAGQEINSDNIFQLRKNIAYVDQDVMIGDGKVEDLIKEYFSLRANRSTLVSNDKLLFEMAALDLKPELLTKNTSQLSGGERQRFALVIALLLQRPIMVLDEVTSSLDAKSKKRVIARLLQQADSTLVVVTHDKEWRFAPGVKTYDFEEKAWM